MGLSFADKLAAAWKTASKRPGATVYIWQDAGKRTTARAGARLEDWYDEDGDPRIRLGSAKMQVNFAKLGFAPAPKPAKRPASVAAAASQPEEETQKRGRKKKEEDEGTSTEI